MKELDDIQYYKERLGVIEPLFAMKQKQFDQLLEITQAANHNLPINALVRIYEGIIYAQLGIQKSALIIKQNENVWECISYHGANALFLKNDFLDYIQQFENVTYITALPADTESEFEFVIPVLFKGNAIAYALLGDMSEGQLNSREEKIKFTQTITNMICVANENKRLATLEVGQKLIQKDLDLASQIQQLLVPKSFPEDNKFQIAGYYKPFRGIGGDYYDFIKLNDQQYFFCMCDISGKGIAAAMLMANFQANLRLTVQQNLTLKDIVVQLNQRVLEITNGDSFITAFLGLINVQTQELEYVNAGHNPCFAIIDSVIKPLDIGCTILGAMNVLPKLESEKVKLSSNSLLVTYTDGITESSNADEELYGDDRLLEFIEANHTFEPQVFNTNLIQSIFKFSEKELFNDDLSLLTIRLL